MKIKVMLVEDEAKIRLILQKMIEKHEEFQVVAQSDELADAVIQFRKKQPDVVFLDIGLKGNSGIECARILTDMNPKIKIIFATGHAEYMPEAFELYAFDYLLKPFSMERLNKTLDRIAGMERRPSCETEETVVKSKYRHNKLLVKGKESMSFVEISEIILIQRENHATVIYTEKDSYVTSASLSDLEKKLDPDQFLRSHKSYIINLHYIRKIEPYGRWTYIVQLKGRKEDALLTAEKYEEIKKRFL